MCLNLRSIYEVYKQLKSPLGPIKYFIEPTQILKLSLQNIYHIFTFIFLYICIYLFNEFLCFFCWLIYFFRTVKCSKMKWCIHVTSVNMQQQKRFLWRHTLHRYQSFCYFKLFFLLIILRKKISLVLHFKQFWILSEFSTVS